MPFSVFVIVPFMEFALPLALKLFPNMLPSTFQDKSKEEERKRKQLKFKLEMATFLKETIQELKSEASLPPLDSLISLYKTSLVPSTLVLADNLKSLKGTPWVDLSSYPRSILLPMAQLLGLLGSGGGGGRVSPDILLRLLIQNRLRELLKDDREIVDEGGIATLSSAEIASAAHLRGIKSGTSDTERELEQWLVLHVNEAIPSVLMLLSRAVALNALQQVTLDHKLSELRKEQTLIEAELATDSGSSKDSLAVAEEGKSLEEAIASVKDLSQEKEALTELLSQVSAGEQTSPIENELRELLKEIQGQVKEIEGLSLSPEISASVTVAQLEEILKSLKETRGKKPEEIKRLVASLDMDNDGRVSIEEIRRKFS